MPAAMSALARPMLRSPTLRLAARRCESTTAQKATQKAQETANKAKEGLSRVTSTAGPAIVGYAKGVSSALGKVGGPVGKTIGLVERQVPSVVYYSKVGLEVGKYIVKGRGMAPPTMANFQAYYQNILKSLQNGSVNPVSIIQQARSLSTAQLAAGGVVAAELLGFFTVGEIIGRFKLVGYRGEVASHH